MRPVMSKDFPPQVALQGFSLLHPSHSTVENTHNKANRKINTLQEELFIVRARVNS